MGWGTWYLVLGTIMHFNFLLHFTCISFQNFHISFFSRVGEFTFWTIIIYFFSDFTFFTILSFTMFLPWVISFLFSSSWGSLVGSLRLQICHHHHSLLENDHQEDNISPIWECSQTRRGNRKRSYWPAPVLLPAYHSFQPLLLL